MIELLDGRITVHAGDCLEVIRTLADCSVDSVVTDPPYALLSISKRFANSPRSEATENTDNPYGRTGRGFMGQRWDNGAVAFSVELWAEVFRVLKPGAHVLAFGGTRTYHRLACAIEDAGFEIRDQIGFAFGTGFPKSHDVSKAIDRMAGAEREVVGVSPFADRKPNGTWTGEVYGDEPSHANGPRITAPATPEAIRWAGWGTALKPAWEPICVARKPLSEPTVAANVLRWGTGAINVDGCRVGIEGENLDKLRARSGGKGERPSGALHDGGIRDGLGEWNINAKGRWPANLIHDGSDEVVAAFPETSAPGRFPKNTGGIGTAAGIYGKADGRDQIERAVDNGSGSAARFFYSAKADSDDRLGSRHPTIKPVDLMQWLVRLVTPKGGLVLDPFAGTGTTGEAAFREGCKAVLIEREPEYLADIERRCSLILAGPVSRSHATVKAKGKPEQKGSLL